MYLYKLWGGEGRAGGRQRQVGRPPVAGEPRTELRGRAELLRRGGVGSQGAGSGLLPGVRRQKEKA